MLFKNFPCRWQHRLSEYAYRCVVRQGEREDALPLAWVAIFERTEAVHAPL